MWSEFKEKTFETYFVGELRLLTNIIYAPDQCDESLLGFDAAAYVPWEFLPPFLPYMRLRRWPHMIGMSAADIDELGKELNNRLPAFKLNLFIQFKRPEYLVRANATEWSFWNREYFRYSLDTKQHALLKKIDTQSLGRAAVVYAVPAFYKSKDLFQHQLDNAIITNSNVLSAALLDGHSKCTFIEAGNRGIGHSQPSEIRGPTLEDLISPSAELTLAPFTKHVKETANFIKVLFEDDEEGKTILDLARRAIIGRDFAEAYPRATGTWFDAVLTMVAFSSAFGIRVCAVG